MMTVNFMTQIKHPVRQIEVERGSGGKDFVFLVDQYKDGSLMCDCKKGQQTGKCFHAEQAKEIIKREKTVPKYSKQIPNIQTP